MGPGRSELVKLYEKGLSYQEIADEYRVTRTSVMRWFKRHGIKPRTRAEARVIAARKYPNSEKQRESARQQAHLARAGQTPETFRKMVATRKAKGVNYSSGERNHFWRGGKAVGLPKGSVWARRARECYKRDGWTCQDCECECISRREADAGGDFRRLVQAHHIVARRNGGNDDLENLVTLCQSCHRKREAAAFDALFA